MRRFHSISPLLVATRSESIRRPLAKAIPDLRPKSVISPLKHASSHLELKRRMLPSTTSSAVKVLNSLSPAALILDQDSLIIGRQIEMLNIFIGFEQANKYEIKNDQGIVVGYIAEDDTKFSKSILRNLMKTRRSFQAVVLDTTGKIILKISRPVKWLLNSKISILDENDVEIGHVLQDFHIWRRKYSLFNQAKTQFSSIDGALLSWDFSISNEEGSEIASVNRNFSGFAREIFTDTGQYVLRFSNQEAKPLGLDDRAIVLACAVNIDIDYFSRHSSGGNGLLPFAMMSSGGGGDPTTSPGGDAAPSSSTGPIGGIPGEGPMSGSGPSDQIPSTYNKWGDDAFVPDEKGQDDGFLSDQDSGVDGGSSWGDMLGGIKDFFDDD